MTLDELVNQMANHLAGRAVKIRWRDPVDANALAQTYKAPDGALIIDITPAVNDETRFSLLLHELAHARLDGDWIGASTQHAKASGSLKRTDAERAAWSENLREKRADELAKAWLAFGQRYAPKHTGASEGWLIPVYKALLTWQPTENKIFNLSKKG